MSLAKEVNELFRRPEMTVDYYLDDVFVVGKGKKKRPLVTLHYEPKNLPKDDDIVKLRGKKYRVIDIEKVTTNAYDYTVEPA